MLWRPLLDQHEFTTFIVFRRAAEPNDDLIRMDQCVTVGHTEKLATRSEAPTVKRRLDSPPVHINLVRHASSLGNLAGVSHPVIAVELILSQILSPVDYSTIGKRLQLKYECLGRSETTTTPGTQSL